MHECGPSCGTLGGINLHFPDSDPAVPDEEVDVRISYARALVLALLAVLPVVASAQSDDHGIRLAKRGLGQANPVAVNLSQDANWLLYGFQRDGISYFQVNDLSGRVELIIGNAGDEFWVLPAGESLARVSLPGRELPLPGGAARTVVYRGSEFTLVRYGAGVDALWSVETP